MENRTASVERVTKETKIRMTLNLDGTGKSDIHTGIGFFDHMLDGFARHGLFDLSVSVDGDLDVDGHHRLPERFTLTSNEALSKLMLSATRT